MENTANLGLKKWEGTDRILVGEFNANWDKIDRALGARNFQFYQTGYTGAGETTKTWTFPAKPLVIFLFGASFWGIMTADAKAGFSQYGSVTSALDYSLSGNEATWHSGSGSPWAGNSKDTQYGIFAILEADWA